jgi:hypothetical protein
MDTSKYLREAYVYAICGISIAEWMLFPAIAHAATAGLGAIGTNIGDNFRQASVAIKYGTGFIGLIMAAAGVKSFHDLQKAHQPTGPAITKFVAGVVLLSITGIIHATSASLFGSSEAIGLQDLGM